MTGIERVALAVAAGLIQSVIVWIVSVATGATRVWPGVILVFALGVSSALMLLRSDPRR